MFVKFIVPLFHLRPLITTAIKTKLFQTRFFLYSTKHKTPILKNQKTMITKKPIHTQHIFHTQKKNLQNHSSFHRPQRNSNQKLSRWKYMGCIASHTRIHCICKQWCISRIDASQTYNRNRYFGNAPCVLWAGKNLFACSPNSREWVFRTVSVILYAGCFFWGQKVAGLKCQFVFFSVLNFGNIEFWWI